MLKVSEATTITFHILDDAVKGLHRTIRESASVGAVSTHPFDDYERINSKLKENNWWEQLQKDVYKGFMETVPQIMEINKKKKTINAYILFI